MAPKAGVLPDPKTMTWSEFLKVGKAQGYNEGTLRQVYTSAAAGNPGSSSGSRGIGNPAIPNGLVYSAGVQGKMGQKLNLPFKSTKPTTPGVDSGGRGIGNPAIPNGLVYNAGVTGKMPTKQIIWGDGNQSPSASMPGEHSGTRIGEGPDRQGRMPPKINPNGGRLQPGYGDDGLGAIIAALNQSSSDGGQNYAYGDFSQQAASQINGIYAPQYAALDRSGADAQNQYKQNDATIAQLYDQLVSRLNTQKQGTAGDYRNMVSAEQGQGQQVADTIAKQYQGTQNHQAELMQKLGLEAAAPDVMKQGTADSAWQQGQAGLQSQNQQHYLTNAGNSITNYLGDLGNASTQQGVSDRGTLIGNLSKQLAALADKRSQLQSAQGSDALALANQLSERDYNMQRDNGQARQAAKSSNVENMIKAYQLKTGAKSDALSQALSIAKEKREQENEALARSAEARAQAKLDWEMETKGLSGYGDFATKMEKTYGPSGTEIGKYVQDVVANSGGITSAPAFNAAVVAKVKDISGGKASPANIAAALEWAKYYMDQMAYGSTGTTSIVDPPQK